MIEERSIMRNERNRVLHQNVQRKQDRERVNLDHCESDNSESWSRELFLVLQVVKEMVEVDQIIPLSVPSETELLMFQWRYNAKYQQSRQFKNDQGTERILVRSDNERSLLRLIEW